MDIEEKELIRRVICNKLTDAANMEGADRLAVAEDGDYGLKMRMPIVERAADYLAQIDAELYRQTSLADKHLKLYKLMALWVRLKQENLSLDTYFLNHGYKYVGIYGLHYVGERLCDELRSTEIEIKYTVDRVFKSYHNIKHHMADEELDPVDVMVVTPITFFEEIKALLQKKVSCPVISIESVINEVLGL